MVILAEPRLRHSLLEPTMLIAYHQILIFSCGSRVGPPGTMGSTLLQHIRANRSDNYCIVHEQSGVGKGLSICSGYNTFYLYIKVS